MGKRSKNERPVLTPPTPQERADSFDALCAASARGVKAKTEARLYPYDYEHLAPKK